MNSKKTLLLLWICVMVSATCGKRETEVKSGLDMLLESSLHVLQGKRVGIITNQTGIASSGEHIVDKLSSIPDIAVNAIFAPEHGFRGDRADAVRIDSYTDDITGIRVWSLYGTNRKPTEEMLEDIDILLYDIQDVGARFYTFISTMGLAMEAAAEHGKKFIVLDRPNPITGTILEGPIIEEQYFSFVGMYPIPVRYGMTPAEMAEMIKGEGWMQGMENLDLVVIPMQGWRRDMWYDETGLPWIKPSPNIPSIITAELYPGTCLFEALNVSEGRGTMHPFEHFGAPWIDSQKLADTMNDFVLPGIYFKPATYTPVNIPGASGRPKYLNETIHGLELIITDRERLRPMSVMVYLFSALKQHYPEEIELGAYLERLIGITSFRSDIDNIRQSEAILKEWEKDIEEFKNIRKKYLMYK